MGKYVRQWFSHRARGGGGPPIVNGLLLEDNVSFILLEDASSILLLE